MAHTTKKSVAKGLFRSALRVYKSPALGWEMRYNVGLCEITYKTNRQNEPRCFDEKGFLRCPSH